MIGKAQMEALDAQFRAELDVFAGSPNPIDNVAAKLGTANAILNALFEQHLQLDQPPTLSQGDVSELICHAQKLVASAHAVVMLMPYDKDLKPVSEL